MTYEQLQAALGIDARAIHRILHDHLGLTKKSARWVPRLLTPEQKQRRVNFARRFLQEFREGESANYPLILTGDETWLYLYEPETKSQSQVWSAVGAPPPKKALRARSAHKVMVAVFFTKGGFFHYIPLGDGSTVTAEWYCTMCLPAVFTALLGGRPQETLRRYFLHHDNAPAHTARRTLEFLAESKVQLVEPAPYSPDLAPCDFWLFPTVKKGLRGRVFQSRQEVLNEFEHEVAKLKKEDFQHCFDRWLYRLRKCVEIGGDYVEK